MSEAQNVNTFSMVIPDPGGDDKQLFLFKAPADNKGGGITIIEAVGVNGAATGAGTTFTYQLLKYSAAGTPAVSGTISDVIGGTATPWADAVPQPFTLATVFVDGGEWVVLDYQEVNTAAPTNSTLIVKYVMGK